MPLTWHPSAMHGDITSERKEESLPPVSTPSSASLLTALDYCSQFQMSNQYSSSPIPVSGHSWHQSAFQSPHLSPSSYLIQKHFLNDLLKWLFPCQFQVFLLPFRNPPCFQIVCNTHHQTILWDLIFTYQLLLFFFLGLPPILWAA